MQKEAALIIGAIIAGLSALLTLLGAGGFDDGLQLEDVGVILLPILGALGIRSQVFSENTVDQIARAASLNRKGNQHG
jgi:hypothetical protein